MDYVFAYSPYRLFLYHELVMEEMKKRGYKVDPNWEDPMYRGRSCGRHDEASLHEKEVERIDGRPLYPEHTDAYLHECLLNLRQKGIDLSEWK